MTCGWLNVGLGIGLSLQMISRLVECGEDASTLVLVTVLVTLIVHVIVVAGRGDYIIGEGDDRDCTVSVSLAS